MQRLISNNCQRLVVVKEISRILCSETEQIMMLCVGSMDCTYHAAKNSKWTKFQDSCCVLCQFHVIIHSCRQQSFRSLKCKAAGQRSLSPVALHKECFTILGVSHLTCVRRLVRDHGEPFTHKAHPKDYFKTCCKRLWTWIDLKCEVTTGGTLQQSPRKVKSSYQSKTQKAADKKLWMWHECLTGEQAVQMNTQKKKNSTQTWPKSYESTWDKWRPTRCVWTTWGTMQWPAHGQEVVGHTSPLLFGKADSSPFTSLDTISRNSDWWARP